MTREEFGIWYENNRDGMLRYASSLLYNSIDIASDIVSEANILLWEKYPYIQTEEEYRKLLCRIILNKAMNIRRVKKEINIEDSMDMVPDRKQPDDNDLIAIDIKRGMEKLPVIDKEALEVSMGYREKDEDIKLETLLKRTDRARKKLKHIIEH